MYLKNKTWLSTSRYIDD